MDTVFFVDVLGIFRPNFKAIRQILIPYKFNQRWNTRVKPKSVFFASKGLETFHAFAAPICQHCGCRQPIEMHETPAKSQEALCRIVFCGKLVLVQCVTNSHRISVRYAGQEKVFQAGENCGISSGFYIYPS